MKWSAKWVWENDRVDQMILEWIVDLYPIRRKSLILKDEGLYTELFTVDELGLEYVHFDVNETMGCKLSGLTSFWKVVNPSLSDESDILCSFSWLLPVDRETIASTVVPFNRDHCLRWGRGVEFQVMIDFTFCPTRLQDELLRAYFLHEWYLLGWSWSDISLIMYGDLRIGGYHMLNGYGYTIDRGFIDTAVTMLWMAL